MKRLLRLIIPVMGLFMPTQLLAYNFLYIHPSTGEPLRWDSTQPIRYYLDPGSLNRLSNDQVHTLIKEAMKLWENASPNADTPVFEFGGYLPEDVDSTNYSKYVSSGQCYTSDLSGCESQSQRDLQTVIVLDDDGWILGNVLCKIGGCAANAGARVFSGTSAEPDYIAQGVLVLGPSVVGNDMRINGATSTILHELGHVLGLAHTSVNQEAIEGLSEELGEDDGLYTPSMFFALLPTGYPFYNNTQVTLAPDDIAGISTLYPSETFETETATIKGQILKSDGSQMMWVNMIARNVDDPLCEAYSWLSGRTCPDGLHTFGSLTGGTCYDDSEIFVPTGNFSISGLPPGTYTIEVEEVADESLAMTLAPGLVNAFIYGDAEFWNEGDVAGDASYLTSSTITLAAGETRENVDIILNRSEVTDDRIQYIPLDTFTPGPGTRCPEEPPVDYAEMIGIDEGGSGDTDGATDSSSSGSSGGCSLIQ